MRILVIGGGGYLGSVLVPALQVRDHSVCVVDLFWFGDHLPKSIEKRQMDARLLTEADLREFDVLIYIAGLSNDPMADFSPLANYESNAALPAYLADQAVKAGIKTFIHGGSCSVYGKISKTANERSTPEAVTPYGLSKLLGELACLQYGRSRTMRVVAFRMGTICGYSPRMRFDLVINAMVKDAMTKGVITVNDPEAYRPILNIKDAIWAYIQAIMDERISGAINIASFNTKIGELATIVRDRVHEAIYGENPEPEFPVIETKNIPDKRSYMVDISRANRLGLFPSNTAGETISDLIRKLTPELRERAEEDEFYNIRTFMKADSLRSISQPS